MQLAKQFSVSLVNKPGRLADLLAALHKGKVGLHALALMTDSSERKTARFIPSDARLAATVLEKINVAYDATDVLVVEVASQSGGFGKVCEKLATEHLSIDYAYCSFNGVHKAKGGCLAVVKVNDLAKAQRALSESSTTRKRMPFRRPVAKMMAD
jgi:hypothetical protein